MPEVPVPQSSERSAAEMLAGLGVPAAADLAGALAGRQQPWRHLGRLLTVPIAGQLWREWHPAQAHRADDPGFLRSLRAWLSEGLRLGIRLDRFRDASDRLGELGDGAASWISPFEDVLAAEDCCVVRLLLSREQYQAWYGPDTTASTWAEQLEGVVESVFLELGLIAQPIRVAVDEALSAPWFRCEWNDLRLPPRRGLEEDRLLVQASVAHLSALGIEVVPGVHPVSGEECAIIDAALSVRAKEAGLPLWDARANAALVLADAIRSAAAALVNRPLVALYLRGLEERSSALSLALRTSFPIDYVVQVLRGLLDEQIGVRDLSTICESMLQLRATLPVDLDRLIVLPPLTGGVLARSAARAVPELLPCDHVEFVRARLRRYISRRFMQERTTLIVFLLDRALERAVAEAADLATIEVPVVRAVREALESVPPTVRWPILLTSLDVRPRLRSLIAPELPHVPVLSYQDLSPDINLQPIARISADLAHAPEVAGPP